MVIRYPNAKINIGLHVTARRSDGFHDLDSLMFPVPFFDILEMQPIAGESPVFSYSGLTIDGAPTDNLCLKAYYSLATRYRLASVHIHLHKRIPMGSGLGGGSSDAAFVLKMLNELFELDLDDDVLEEVAVEVGSDCPFFIKNKPAIATGKGEVLRLSSVDLEGMYLRVVMPEFRISTAEAYQWIRPDSSRPTVTKLTALPVEVWRDHLANDFEEAVLEKYPEGRLILDALYESGAVYAQMSGSGSAFFGLYRERPGRNEQLASITVFEGSL